MEILIVSDSHGKKENIKRLLRAHQGAKYLLFLGDGLRDTEDIIEQFPRIILASVRGNCDFCCTDTPDERLLEINGVHILMMHGHLCGVKGGVGAAICYAKKQNADLLLFGHTHLPYEEYVPKDDGMLCVFNPGSIGKKEIGKYSYGVLEIRENGFLVSHGSLE
jgi:putative phosphoesterase